MPLSATLASKSIFDAFLSDKKVDALLHGHSYTANPVGCAVALKAIEMVEKHEAKGGWDKEREMWSASASASRLNGQTSDSMNQGSGTESRVIEDGDDGRWSFWSPGFVRNVSMMESVKGAMALGTVCAIELEDNEGGE